MIALGFVVFIPIIAVAVGVIVFAFALAKTSARADRMSQRWLEEQWLADHRREQWYADHGFITAEEFERRNAEFYDQDEPILTPEEARRLGMSFLHRLNEEHEL